MLQFVLLFKENLLSFFPTAQVPVPPSQGQISFPARPTVSFSTLGWVSFPVTQKEAELSLHHVHPWEVFGLTLSLATGFGPTKKGDQNEQS